MMKCKHCNGTGQEKIYDTLTNAYLLIKCAYCNGSGKLPQTNEEWFNALSTEEKAKEIYKIAKDDFKELRKQFYGVANDDIDAIAMWLKDEHNG